MKRLTLQQQKEIIEAALAGKPIEVRPDGIRQWSTKTIGEGTAFDFLNSEYRVKIVPQEIFCNEYRNSQTCQVFRCGHYATLEEADESAARDRIRVVKFREVTEE